MYKLSQQPIPFQAQKFPNSFQNFSRVLRVNHKVFDNLFDIFHRFYLLCSFFVSSFANFVFVFIGKKIQLL